MQGQEIAETLETPAPISIHRSCGCSAKRGELFCGRTTVTFSATGCILVCRILAVKNCRLQARNPQDTLRLSSGQPSTLKAETALGLSTVLLNGKALRAEGSDDDIDA